jgi:hypothetical protein
MKAIMAIMARDVMARRELPLMAVAVAILISFLPILPNIETFEATDVRTVASSVSALALGCLLALLLGATVFGNDLSEGRLSFFFARPVSGLAVWWGRVLAVMALVWIVEIIVLAPALYHEGIRAFTSSDGADWLTILAYVVAPLLFFLLAHAVSILVRAGTPWMFLDLGGAIVVAVFVWLNLTPVIEIGAPIAMWVVAGTLVAALLISLTVGGASGVAVGRVDLRRVHSAQSLALWSTMAICLAAITVYGGWLRNFGPREFNDVDVITVAPDGGWVEAVGRAKGRLDVKRRYLISTTRNRWLPLPRQWEHSDGVAVFSRDGSTAVWRGGGPVEEPRSLLWADLGRPDPMARPTSILVSDQAALTLSGDGTRLAILEEGTASIYELGEERLVKAIRLSEDLHRAAVIFVSLDTLRLYARSGVENAQSVLIAEIDTATGELVRTGAISGLGKTSWFAVDAALERLVVWTRSEGDRFSERRLHDAKNGALKRNLNIAGFPRFLQDGRMVLSSEDDNGSIELVVEQVEGDGWMPHTLGASDGSRVHGEAVPNGVVVSHLVDPGDRTQGIRLALIDVDSGEARNIGSHLRSTIRRFPWQAGVSMGFFWYCDEPAVARLFIDQSGALVRWDPETGEMVHVVGGRAP